MNYELHQLSAGNSDLILDGIIIGSVVRNTLPGGHHRGWRAELSDDRSEALKPEPFTESEHTFGTLVEATDWLGKTLIIPKQRWWSNA